MRCTSPLQRPLQPNIDHDGRGFSPRPLSEGPSARSRRAFALPSDLTTTNRRIFGTRQSIWSPKLDGNQPGHNLSSVPAERPDPLDRSGTRERFDDRHDSPPPSPSPRAGPMPVACSSVCSTARTTTPPTPRLPPGARRCRARARRSHDRRVDARERPASGSHGGLADPAPSSQTQGAATAPGPIWLHDGPRTMNRP
jgi:hypothetical protein